MNTDDRAFPVSYKNIITGEMEANPGIRVRDHIAIKAMQGMLAHGYGDAMLSGAFSSYWDISEIPRFAYHLADEMIRESNK